MAVQKYTFYVDETCHLEHDGFPVMCVGYIKVPDDKIGEYKDSIKQIKRKHHLLQEVKWNTVSFTHLLMYKEIIDFFFSSQMEFRCVLVTYKDRLDKEAFMHGDPDNFYYKMIYNLLYNPYINHYDGTQEFKVFLDLKDTRGRERLNKIQTIFQNNLGGASPFIRMQHIQSYESQFIQLTDLLIGAIAYSARSLDMKEGASRCKIALMKYIEEKSGYTLNEGTEPGEQKFNIFNHQPRKKNE